MPMNKWDGVFGPPWNHPTPWSEVPDGEPNGGSIIDNEGCHVITVTDKELRHFIINAANSYACEHCHSDLVRSQPGAKDNKDLEHCDECQIKKGPIWPLED